MRDSKTYAILAFVTTFIACAFFYERLQLVYINIINVSLTCSLFAYIYIHIENLKFEKSDKENTDDKRK